MIGTLATDRPRLIQTHVLNTADRPQIITDQSWPYLSGGISQHEGKNLIEQS